MKTISGNRRNVRRTGPNAVRLEPRIMFDGAAAADAVDFVAASPEVTAPAVVAEQADQSVEQPQAPAARSADTLAQVQQRATDLINTYLDGGNSADTLFAHFHGNQTSASAEWVARTEALLDRISEGDYGVAVQFVNADQINDAYAAFAAEGPNGQPTIFVNTDWWRAQTDIDVLAGVMVEEYGHSFDHALNGAADSAGDEGEAFAAAVVGRTLNSFDQARIAFEDDSAVVEIDGAAFEMEMAKYTMVNAYEVVSEVGKETNTHDFDYNLPLGVVRVDDDVNSRLFSGNDISAIGFNIGGEDVYGWISRPIKAQGVVRGFYFWTDADFTNLALAQADGNSDGDRDITDNRGFVLVVDQAYFDSLAFETGTIKNVGSSSDKVDAALNALIGPNVAPTAVNDSLTVVEDSTGNTGNVLTNDLDPEYDALTVTGFSIGGVAGTLGVATVIPGGVGTFTMTADGAYSFAPAANYAGAVPAITYTVSDGELTASATLAIAITPVNDAPTGADNSITVKENQAHTFSAADFGFSDPTDAVPNALQSVIITTLPASGTLTLDGVAVTAGQEITAAQITKLLFAPTGDEAASFTFQVRDTGGTDNGGINLDPDARTMSFTVTAANKAPVAVADTAQIDEGATSVAGDVITSSDSDPDGDALSVVSASGVGATVAGIGAFTVTGLYGTLTINSDGTYSYALDNSDPAVQALLASTDTLVDTFSYTVADAGNLTASSTLTVTIRGTNDAPVAANDANVAKESLLTDGTEYTGADPLGYTAVGNVLNNDGDPDLYGETKTITGLTGSVVGSTGNTMLIFNAPPSNVGPNYYAFMNDGGNAGAPLLDADGVHIQIAGTYVKQTDGGNIPLTGNVANFTVEAGTIVYFANQIGGGGSGGAATVSSLGSSGVGTEVSLTGAVTGTIAEGMTVSWDDGLGGTATDTVVAVSYDVGGDVTGFTLGSSQTLSGTTLTFSAAAGDTITGRHGTLVLNADGSYVYTPTADTPDLADGDSGVDAFAYTMRDAAGATDDATLLITVFGSGNSDPFAAADTNTVDENSGTAADGWLLTNDTPTTGSLTVTGAQSASGAVVPVTTDTEVTGSYGTLTLSDDGSYSYVLDDGNAEVDALLTAGDTLTETFLYHIDNGFGVDAATLTITIQGANDAPVAVVDTAIAYEASGYANATLGQNATGNVLLNDTDVDTGDTRRVTQIEGSAVTTSTTVVGLYGSLLINSDGSYTYTVNDDNAAVQALNVGGTLTDTFTYTLADTANASDTGTLAITIRGANDAPATTVPSAAATVDEGGSVLLSDITVADDDDASLTVALSVQNGTLTIGDLSGAVIDEGADGTDTITLTGTKAQLNDALATLSYQGGADFSGVDTLRVETTDSGDLSDVATLDIEVAPDDRTLVVTGTTVNEASPYIVFSVSGVAGQKVTLALTETGASADLGLDLLSSLEVYNGTAWVAYTGAAAAIPAGGVLLVRAPVLDDSLDEGAETIGLVATNKAGTAFNGTGTIVDDGTGAVYLATNTTGTGNTTGDAGYPEYLDDDRALAVNDITVNEASPQAVFTVTGEVGQVVRLALVDGTATGADFGPGIEVYDGSAWVAYTPDTDHTLTATTLLVRTAIVNDAVFEGQEAFFLGVTQMSSGATTHGTANVYDDGTGSVYWSDNTTGTPSFGIPDDDRTVSIDSPIVNEASDVAVFTLTGNAGQSVTLQLVNQSVGGTVLGKADVDTLQTLQVWDGLDWVDYDEAATLPTFDADGKIFVRVDVTAEQDTVYEGSETFILSASLTGQDDTSDGTATIKDDGTGVIHAVTGTGGLPFVEGSDGLDDDRPSVASVGDAASVTEGQAAAFTVTLSNASATSETYSLALASGTATVGTDVSAAMTFSNGVTYNAATGLVTVPAGVTSFTVTVPTTDDAVVEPTEGFTLTVGGVEAAGTVLDNDGAAIGSIGAVSVTEGQAAVFAVTLTAESLQAETFALALTSGTATVGTDVSAAMTFSNGVTYNAATGLVTVPAGVTSFTVTVPTTDDAVVEPTEGFTLTVGGVAAAGTVLDNDSAAVGSVGAVSVTEGQAAVFTVTLSNASAASETYSLALASGTATVGADVSAAMTFSNGVTYNAATGLVTVPAGVTSFTVTVPTTDDAVVEDAEGFTLTVGGVAAAGTVLDNDGAAVGSVGAVSVTEGQAAVFAVTLTAESARAETYSLALASGTATVGADVSAAMTFSNGVTYNAATGLVTVPAGVTSFTVTVPTTDDAVVEPTEGFTLTVGGVEAAGTVLDNDSAAIGSVGAVSVTEGQAAVFTVTLTAESTRAETYSLALASGTATVGADVSAAMTFSNGVTYNAATGLVTVPAGVTSFTVTVPTTDDDVVEDAESFTLTVGGVAAAGSIADNDVDTPPPPVPPAPPPAAVAPAPPAPPTIVTVPAPPAPPAALVGPPIPEPEAGVSMETPDFGGRVQSTEGFPVRVAEGDFNGGRHELRVDKAIPDLVYPPGTASIEYVIPVDAFVHTDENAEVQLSALMLDGTRLPSWMTFDPVKGEFTGTPPAGFRGELQIRVIARDEAGRQAETLIVIRVGERTAALQGKSGLTTQLQAGGIFAWKAERDTLIQQSRDVAQAARDAQPSDAAA